MLTRLKLACHLTAYFVAVAASVALVQETATTVAGTLLAAGMVFVASIMGVVLAFPITDAIVGTPERLGVA